MDRPDPPRRARLGEAPLFLARANYRRRRLMDAARLLPVLGWILFMVPLLWFAEGSEIAGARTAVGGLYIFAVWGVLILCAACLSRPLRRCDAEERSAEDQDPEA
jgi:uncharacterized membrane protein YgdD (TMEM256/DUF423 family)